ncbi:lysylphosphatidylglycerol synthase transmembrane domain-containing protein [Sphingobacterium sp. CZ-2]|uniref:lysylphosphatidylglycerol synthase transmembrane domain-containing protein n=1 Tax=Sphingobacterium sp. CZ-2 TaxID=2557994 RepID=UPI00106FB84B|nr:lysylphosphatidylglycerol synthase transmembrane domain-containing protein [Sphingobacterium sp. CZ-2]QBR12594.1 flippase-like domain-containing protein [Sphingobacterium sp. CZ-2]
MGRSIKITKKRVKQLLLISIVVFIGIFLWNTDFQSVWKELSGIGFRFLYLLGITYLAYLIGTWSWHVCLGKERSKISVFRLFSLRQVGETVGLYNPTSIIGGDMLKAELLKPYGISKSVAINSVASSRVTAVLSQILLFLGACVWLISNPAGMQAIQRFGWVFYLIFVVLLVAKIGLFIWLSKSGKKHTSSLKKPRNFLEKIYYNILNLLNDIRSFYQENTRTFWFSYALATLHWIVGSLEFYFILLFLGFDVLPMHGLLLDMSVIVFKSLGAFVPGQLGVEELGNKLMLAAIGITGASVWITVSILRRARQLSWIVIGFILYLFIKKEINHVATATS